MVSNFETKTMKEFFVDMWSIFWICFRFFFVVVVVARKLDSNVYPLLNLLSINYESFC